MLKRFFKQFFSPKKKATQSYEAFWHWFQKREQAFFHIIDHQKNIEEGFFDKLSAHLSQLRDGYNFLAGMHNEKTAELIFTADGEIANFVFVEELVDAAPKIEGWKFTAHKPALTIENVRIEMGEYAFHAGNMSFFSTDHPEYPDEIDITVVHEEMNVENKSAIEHGIYIFLDNYLGELHFATMIDSLSVIEKKETEEELVPINKLKDFLVWREKEFIEKYEAMGYDTENDQYSMLQATLKNGYPLLAVINRDLLQWEDKASHPWFLNIEMRYDGKHNQGMPDEDSYQLMGEIEDNIIQVLKDIDGYLNIGRETADNSRHIYFACKEFRKPSKVMDDIQKAYASRIDLSFEIYKDKYWQSVKRFSPR